MEWYTVSSIPRSRTTMSKTLSARQRSRNRPTDVDSFVAQARAVASASPSEAIHGWTDDFRKTFKQVPSDPRQLENIVLVQNCPETDSPAFFVPFAKYSDRRVRP